MAIATSPSTKIVTPLEVPTFLQNLIKKGEGSSSTFSLPLSTFSLGLALGYGLGGAYSKAFSAGRLGTTFNTRSALSMGKGTVRHLRRLVESNYVDAQG
jgi:hypothetical protein